MGKSGVSGVQPGERKEVLKGGTSSTDTRMTFKSLEDINKFLLDKQNVYNLKYLFHALSVSHGKTIRVKIITVNKQDSSKQFSSGKVSALEKFLSG